MGKRRKCSQWLLSNSRLEGDDVDEKLWNEGSAARIRELEEVNTNLNHKIEGLERQNHELRCRLDVAYDMFELCAGRRPIVFNGPRS